ncbi:MAG TPA: succinate dehydrogenase flavoprotein subunit, partial [Patescibacteria group bacterium]|nr:succinate dehydrogenase flavoprotein subunit [Patescibacteria group bacterium]
MGRPTIPETRVHELDAVVVGAGGAGLYAALELKQELGPEARIGVISKLYPSRSHTGAAQGGVCAALGNTEEDHWEWLWFDTVKGGDYLVDQDAAEVMCHDAVETIINLEHLGLPFDRTDDGLINQRRFGGHTRNYGEGPVRRSCFAADRTGHAILQTLFQQCIKHEVLFYDEYQVLDLALPDGPTGPVAGVIALQTATTELHAFRAKAVLFATGGYGKVFKVTSNAHTLTGDGMAIPYRRGLPLEDMEFFQFHPTGMYKLGFLLSEAMRGEGGFLVNDQGERFMERYAPTMKDLASRDVVSRSIYLEIAEGRGIGGKDYVHLDVRHLGAEVLNNKLPDMSGFIRTYFGLDPLTDLVPIQPTAHYAMGGVPTDVDGRVLADASNAIVPGFYAAGEVACVSVHGANRLGTNSLLDILVFGRRAGKRMAADLAGLPEPARDLEAEAATQSRISSLLAATDGERPAVIRNELQEVMFTKCGVYRTEALLTECRDEVRALRDRAERLQVDDKGCRYNPDLGEALELGYLLDCAEATVESALARTESRG